MAKAQPEDMKHRYTLVALIIFIVGNSCAPDEKNETITDGDPIIGEEIRYNAGDDEMIGYIVTNDSIEGKRAGIIVVHEWWGLNAYAKQRARDLAELGYTAMAIDMYGGGKTVNTPDSAKSLAGMIYGDPELAKTRFKAALDILKKHGTVDTSALGAIGFCFGGGVVLNMAMSGVPVDAVVSFHGGLPSPASIPDEAAEIKAKILVLNGGADPVVSKESIEKFRSKMDSIGAEYVFINYPGAMHAFTNPAADSVGKKYDLPIAYDEQAARKSWQRMEAFFEKRL